MPVTEMIEMLTDAQIMILYAGWMTGAPSRYFEDTLGWSDGKVGAAEIEAIRAEMERRGIPIW